MDPQEQYLTPAHSAMRSAQPKHAAGSDARHTPAAFHTLGPKGTARRHTPLRHEEPNRPAPPGPLTAPVPPPASVARYSHVQPGHLSSAAVSSATNPATAGKLIPAGTRKIAREGQPVGAPTNHREAIHSQATSRELMARNRERAG